MTTFEKLIEKMKELITQPGFFTPRETKMLEMRFGLLIDTKPQTYEEVGKEFSVTRERIRQIEAKALEKISSTYICNYATWRKFIESFNKASKEGHDHCTYKNKQINLEDAKNLIKSTTANMIEGGEDEINAIINKALETNQ